ncbi:hypothetical protein BdWA1_002791 [Babesia duncani]|uniref:Nucleoside transporter n=1 Tax=Babesia duncani TaxID=323732 RepID=A0AAD9PKE8_9APIC|nr:hypothetical protein BdWA1_002791 [Babesia duncani]
MDLEAKGNVCNSTEKVVSHLYTLITSIFQGMTVVLCPHICHTFATMVPVVLETNRFGSTVAFSMHIGIVVGSLMLLLTNPLYPLMMAIACFLQSFWFVVMILVITFTTGNTGKNLFILVSFLLGITAGSGGLTSFTAFTMVKGNYLPSFAFGLSMGALVSFLLSTFFKIWLFPSQSIEDVYHAMVVISVAAILVGILCGSNMLFFSTRKDVIESLTDMSIREKGATFSFKKALTGLKSCTNFLIIDGIALLILMSFYPGVVPTLWNVTVNERVILVGTIQVSMTISRGYSVAFAEKFQISHAKGIFFFLLTSIVSVVYFMLIIYNVIPGDSFLSSIYTKVFSCFIFSSVISYSLTFGFKGLKKTLPPDMDKASILSTTALYSACRDVFRMFGCGISELVSLMISYTVVQK